MSVSSKKINVLIAEDSAVVTQLLKTIFDETDDIHVIACAKNGIEAVELTQKLKPNLITMDIQMPEMDGFEATKKIMSTCPTPIVVISSQANSTALNTTFNALNAGALAVIEKPHNILSDGFSDQKRYLLNTIRALSEVHVIRRRIETKSSAVPPVSFKKNILIEQEIQLLALGASTGGPEALHLILSQLPASFPLPIVAVQHISDGFLPGFVSWLQKKSALTVDIVKENYQPLLPGHIYFAPDGLHLTIQKENRPVAFLEDSAPIEYFKPSVTRLFSSIAASYPNQAMAGLLTGMGRDGAEGLLQMKKSGCQTFIQSESSCVVFGMPGAAQHIHAECDVIELTKIPAFLKYVFNKEK